MDKIDSEIISEIENGNLKKFNQEDVQDIQCLSNISDELNEIKRANNLNNNRHVVLKFLKENDEDKYYDIFNREIKNLIKIYPNENVIKCFGVTKDPSKNFYSIVLEYCGDKNLSEDLEVVSKKGWPYKIKMAKGIANGLNYIHMENIILCNLNSKNIISHNDKLVIADFSSSISLDSQMKSTIKITDKNVAYVDPKCFNRIDMFNKSSDIYSLGVILWEISSGRPPFSNNQLNIDDFKKSLVLGKRESPINLTPVDYKELYCDAWNKDQHNRLSASEVINCLEEIEPDLLYQNSVYIPEISYKMNNSISQKKACLKIIEGSSQSNGIFLREGEMLIGRKSSNDIVIKDHEVDKEHASIKNYQGKVEIIGLGSKSKIFVIGEQLEFRTLYPLKRNDIIKMGQSTFQYIPAGEYENYIDPLLMIYNTAYLRKSLENEFKNSKNLSLSLLFFDLDQFEITNEYSNEAADYVLMELSKLIQNKYVRDKDTFARYGDANEFAILLIDTNVESAYEIANEIRCFVETYPFNFKEKKLQSITLNLNIGISEMNSSVKSSKDLLNHAKEACRRAKEYGSNQIVIWENDQISIQKVYLGFLNFLLYSKFAKNGNHWDENNLGKCYKDGIGTKKNVQKAFRWFEKSAKGGNHLGQCNLGHCYRDAIGTQENELKSLHWYMKSAEDGNRSAQVILTNWFQEGMPAINENTFQFVKKSAKDGNHLGQGLLASCYIYGIGVNKAEKEAFQWANKSAQGGNALGQNILGICYQNGFGVEKDNTKAFKWYERSAHGGDTKGQRNLGTCYQKGIGVEKDDVKASFWFEKSAQDGSINTQCNLSIIDIIHVISDIFSIMFEMFGSFSKPILLFIVPFFALSIFFFILWLSLSS